jgi:argininosuccinate lyase
MAIGKLWGGRFEDLPPQQIIDFLSGRDVRGTSPCDARLIPYDLWGSRAHTLMLCRQGILTQQDGRKILRGLREIARLNEKGEFSLDPSKEDVHSNIESFLIDRLGIEFGGKIHTGRSRNDQIGLDMRLYLRDQALAFSEELVFLMKAILNRAEEHLNLIMPGYTHHQHASPTTLGHVMLSFCEPLERDLQRFFHWRDLFNRNPLGSAAGYGTSFVLDRRLTSRLLGFDGPTENVTDAITQRWEPEADLAYAAAIMTDHLSSLAQTLILLSSSEFNMIRLADRHCTGSSIMPQKRNPCTLEVMKAKASFAQGVLVSLLSTGKGLFMGYNRDTQWTKYWIMDLVDELLPALPVMADVIQRLEANKAEMMEQGSRGFIGATALMEWMVRNGSLPLRRAKMAVERAVRYSEGEGMETVSFQALRKALGEMEIDLPVSEAQVRRVQRPEVIVSPTKTTVRRNLASLQRKVSAGERRLKAESKAIKESKRMLSKMEREIGI